MDGVFRPVALPPEPTHALEDQAAPMLQWVALADLVIDGRYQRDITAGGWGNIRRIAADFRWSRFSPLLVAPIEGGRFAVIDGQHRAHAAALCGVETVPAMVVPMDLREQALAFGGVNGTVTKVDIFALYRAALAAGVDWAVACERVVREGGCRLLTGNVSSLTRKPRDLTCIGVVRAHVCEGTGEVVTACLRGITASADRDCVDMYQMYVFKPFAAAVASSTRYLRADLAEFLSRHDLIELVTEARNVARAKIGGGSPPAIAQAMIEARLHAFTREAAA